MAVMAARVAGPPPRAATAAMVVTAAIPGHCRLSAVAVPAAPAVPVELD